MAGNDPIREALERAFRTGFDRGFYTADQTSQQPDLAVEDEWSDYCEALSLLTTKASDDELVERVARAMAPSLFKSSEDSVGPATRYERNNLRRYARAALSSMPTIADEGERECRHSPICTPTQSNAVNTFKARLQHQLGRDR